MINPMGLYAMGMSSSRDPDVAGRAASQMFVNGLAAQQEQERFDEQMRLRKEAELRKQQELELGKQALSGYAKSIGLDEAQAGMLPYLPEGVQAGIVNQKAGMVTPYQQQMIDMKREQIEEAKRLKEEQVAREKQVRIEGQAEKLADKLGDKSIPELATGMNDLKALITEYEGADVPGFGKTGWAPRFLLSDGGKDMRQAVDKVKNLILSARSGAAVTESEASRLLSELGIDEKGNYKARTDDELRQGVMSAYNGLRAVLKNRKAGVDPEAVKLYKERGGTALDLLDEKPKAAEGGLPPWATPDKIQEYKKLRGL